MIFKVETKQGVLPYEFKDKKSAEDYVMGFLSWYGTKYRILKVRQTWSTEDLIDTAKVEQAIANA